MIRRAQYTAFFTSRNAAMQRYYLNDFYDLPADQESRSPLLLVDELLAGKTSLALRNLTITNANGLAQTIDLRGVNWTLIAAPEECDLPVEKTPHQLIFAYQLGDLQLRRVYDFSPVINDEKNHKNNFGFKHTLILQNKSAQNLQISSVEMTAMAGIIPDDADKNFGLLKAVSGYFIKPAKIERVEDDLSKFKDLSEFAHSNRDTAWLGFNNRFFTSLMLVGQAEKSLSVRFEKINLPLMNDHTTWRNKMLSVHQYQGEATLISAGINLAPQASAEYNFAYYGGPLDDNIAENFSSSLNDIATFSWAFLKPISNILLFILNYFAMFTLNYGWAIVLLTLLVKVVLHPLTRKSMKSQKAMQKIQPLIKQIKEQYKKEPQRQQQETMRIFRENGVNPVGGCLPMLLQMPIFFALYGVFARCFAMRQQPFISGWIDDLSQPDTVATFNNIPFFTTFNLNPLPLVYLVLQFWHMSMMPKSADPQMQSQQKMMRLMPLIFVFIFYSMPSGLVLYFAVQSLFTIIEYFLIKMSHSDEPTITDNGMKVVDGKVVATTIPAGKGFKK